MNGWLTHERLYNRYCFRGTLISETGLHIGSGLGSTQTDALVIRTANNAPYVPGSSLKGALRSAVERIVPNLGIQTCLLDEDGDQPCLTVSQELRNWLTEIHERVETARRTGQGYARVVDPAARERLLKHPICTAEELQDPGFVGQLPYRFVERTLCHTCQLFGSTALAAKMRVADLPIKGDWAEITEIRDGVGIDRDTETARPKVKFDLEVVPAGTEFVFRLDAENLNQRDLGLLCIGLQELRAGMVPLGGRSSRGLGGCRLMLKTIHAVDLTNGDALVAYLTATEDKRMSQYSGAEIDDFIKTSIGAVLA